MDTFGDQLKQERERRNVALDEIARSTKIRVRYLRALEDGQHERLPGIVFAKGYVRAYAETIGADADRLVAAYVDEQRSLGRLETETSQEGVLAALAAAVDDGRARNTRRGRSAMIVALVVLVVGVSGWFGLRPLLQRDETASVEAPPAAPEPRKTATPVEISVPAESSVPVEDNEPVAVENVVEALPEAPTAAAGAALTVPDYGVGTGVRQHTLVGRASSFAPGTQVVFWTRVLGGARGSHVRHVWLHEGVVAGTVDLSLGGPHWRTYSRRTLRQSGSWSVEARDETGRVLARETFVTAPGS